MLNSLEETSCTHTPFIHVYSLAFVFQILMCVFFTSHMCTLLLDLSVVLSMVIRFSMLDRKRLHMHDGVLDLAR